MALCHDWDSRLTKNGNVFLSILEGEGRERFGSIHAACSKFYLLRNLVVDFGKFFSKALDFGFCVCVLGVNVLLHQIPDDKSQILGSFLVHARSERKN